MEMRVKGSPMILIVVGIIFLVVGIILIAVDVSKEQYKVETTAIITDISESTRRVEITDSDGYTSYSTETDYTVYVKYEVDGKTYNSKLNSYSATYYEGKEISVYYYSNEPDKVYTTGSVILKYILVVAGIIVTILGVVLKVKNKNYE